MLLGNSSHAATLESDSNLAEAGFYSLNWRADDFDNFELQEAADQAFARTSTIYRGPDLATSISGRSDGDYFYRLRGITTDGTTGPWSDTVKVTVRHHPLSRALLFFAAGAVVFFATLFVIISGPRQQD